MGLEDCRPMKIKAAQMGWLYVRHGKSRAVPLRVCALDSGDDRVLLREQFDLKLSVAV